MNGLQKHYALHMIYFIQKFKKSILEFEHYKKYIQTTDKKDEKWYTEQADEQIQKSNRSRTKMYKIIR